MRRTQRNKAEVYETRNNVKGKICIDCGEWHPLSEYRRLQSNCKKCQNDYVKERKNTQKAQGICINCGKFPIAEWSTQHCPECSAKYALASSKNAAKRGKYTPPSPDKKFQELYLAIRIERMPCEVCGEYHENNMVIDHDHSTGEIRGVLCNTCNISGEKHDPRDMLALKVGRAILNSQIGYLDG